MRAERGSVTARAIAWIRAIESQLPERDRVVDDDLARVSLGTLFGGALRLCGVPLLGTGFLAVFDGLFPGLRGGIVGRTRFIDDALTAALREGVAQVVVLGAGFDSRAYRIPGIRASRVFELDHPATQAQKRRCIERAAVGDTSHVVFVPIDFETQKLDDALTRSGFRRARTFWILEGVTDYIGAAAVDATFRFVAGASEAGSRIAFTYTDRGALDGSKPLVGATAARLGSKMFGEKMSFGFDPEELANYLAARGLLLLEDVAAPEYEARYFDPLNRKLQANEYERAVLAAVGSEP